MKLDKQGKLLKKITQQNCIKLDQLHLDSQNQIENIIFNLLDKKYTRYKRYKFGRAAMGKKVQRRLILSFVHFYIF